MLDVAPALRDRQRHHLADSGVPVQFFVGDAQNLDLAGRTFNVIIANEVLADFEVADAHHPGEQEADGAWRGPGARLIKDYDLSMADAPSPCLLNQGAFRFIERLRSHLAPGSMAFLIEYGGRDRFPTPTEHLDHPEYSIHFGHLEQCARAIGLDARVESLTRFLGADEGTAMLTGGAEKILCLNRAFRRHERRLPFAAFSEEDFQALYGDLAGRLRLTGLSYKPLRWGYHFGPCLDQFWVLILTRP
jgi:hypothetical protein